MGVFAGQQAKAAGAPSGFEKISPKKALAITVGVLALGAIAILGAMYGKGAVHALGNAGSTIKHVANLTGVKDAAMALGGTLASVGAVALGLFFANRTPKGKLKQAEKHLKQAEQKVTDLEPKVKRAYEDVQEARLNSTYTLGLPDENDALTQAEETHSQLSDELRAARAEVESAQSTVDGLKAAQFAKDNEAHNAKVDAEFAKLDQAPVAQAPVKRAPVHTKSPATPLASPSGAARSLPLPKGDTQAELFAKLERQGAVRLPGTPSTVSSAPSTPVSTSSGRSTPSSVPKKRKGISTAQRRRLAQMTPQQRAEWREARAARQA
ncbi:MAG: hypothetical protein SP1CHLAM54_11940 [Chlamydiia bacterium]|nr:hypothetical protein [Chlamydiia bacterium]MCH9616093.1 hypothetical protein [Chlamydiia bacterium]MCH9629484.1 hypothetical protein [Chlamydiia bacterium]